MRSRTELVTTQLEGSEFEDETDFEDSEEDWQPAKDDPKNKAKLKSPSRPRKSAAGNKNGTKQRGRKSVKKSKKKASSEEDEEPTDEDIPIPAKKAKTTTSESVLQANEVKNPASSSNVKEEPTTSAVPSPKPQPLQRKISNPVKSFPDKCGFLNLYIFKGDLQYGIINNTQVCLWRRDGSSLLQKYLRDITVTTDIPQYASSMVYSCWEDKRADEYLEVKVKCLDQTKQIRVELVDASELEAKAVSEYESYVTIHGVPPPRNNTKKARNDNSGGTEDEDDDDAEEDYDDVEDGEEDETLKQEE